MFELLFYSSTFYYWSLGLIVDVNWVKMPVFLGQGHIVSIIDQSPHKLGCCSLFNFVAFGFERSEQKLLNVEDPIVISILFIGLRGRGGLCHWIIQFKVTDDVGLLRKLPQFSIPSLQTISVCVNLSIMYKRLIRLRCLFYLLSWKDKM